MMKAWFRRKNPSHTIEFSDARSYLSQEGMPEPLIRELMFFVADLARENGEDAIGEQTMSQLKMSCWSRSGLELESVFGRSPHLISEYVQERLADPGMPLERELTRPVEHYSETAKLAYLFLSEGSLRMLYGVLYEDESVKRNRHRRDELEAAVAMDMANSGVYGYDHTIRL